MLPPSSVRMLAVGVVATTWLAGCAHARDDNVRAHWATTYAAQDRQESSSATPGESPPSPSSLAELLHQAERSNPGLRAAFDRWTAALERVPQAKSLPDPKVSYAYFIESVETRVGPQRQKFGITQTIPLFGKLGLRGEITLNAANAAGAKFELARRELHYNVTRLWNEYHLLHRTIAITEENFRLMSYLEEVALARYTAGKTPHASVIRAQIELGRLEDRLQTLRDQRRPLLASLNAELNQPAQIPIAWPDSLAYENSSQSPEDLTKQLLATNPRLAALQFLVNKEAAAERLAGRGPIPDLTIGAEYVDTDEAAFPNVPDSGKDAAIAKATISIPLWFGKHKAAQAQATARRNASERELLHLQNKLSAELERVHFELRDAGRRVELYAHTLLPKAQQSLEVTEDAFTSGDVTFLELVDAQRTLLEFELAHERALTDRATTYAHLLKLIGPEPAADSNTEGVQ